MRRHARCSSAPSDVPIRCFARRVDVNGDHWEAVFDDRPCELVDDLVSAPLSSDCCASGHLATAPAGVRPTAEEERGVCESGFWRGRGVVDTLSRVVVALSLFFLARW